MKSVTRSITYFTCGAIVASLPWLLASRQTIAQGGQERPPAFAGAGPAQQGFPGAPAQPGAQFRPQGGAPINTIAFSGDYMYVGAGDTVYKVDHRGRGNEPMRIISTLRLGQNFGQPGRQPDGRPRNPGVAAPPQRDGGGTGSVK